MGAGRLPIFTPRCPWAQALADCSIGRWLSTYWMVKDLRVYPPGRQDPQLLDAFAVIASEHNALRSEAMESK